MSQSDTPRAGGRVLMIALDALDAALVDRFLGEGRLPNLAAFAREAERLDVTSKGEVLHGASWPTFSTGTNAGTHGVYFWIQWLEEEMRHVRNNHPAFALTPWWSELSRAGRRATVIDVPYITPVALPGFRTYMGWGLHDEVIPVAYPAGFKERIDSIAGKSPLTTDTMEPQSSKSKLAMIRDVALSADKRCRILIEIAGDGEWDLLLTTFGEFHKAGHYLSAPAQLSPQMSNVDGMAEIAKAFDRHLPAILEAAGPNCQVLIFAVHGMRQQFDYSGFGEQLLAIQAGRRPVDPETRPDLVRRVRNMIPDPVHRFLWRRLPASVRASRQHQISTGRADLAHDRLFPVVHDGQAAIRANLRGRERDGFVSNEEAEELFRGLETLAAGFTTLSGVPAFPRMWRSAVEEPGARSHRLPDVFLVANPEIVQAARLQGSSGVVLSSARAEVRNGVHTSSGFCFYRPSPDVTITRRSVDNTDFGPTILKLFGISSPMKFDGTSFIA